MVYLWYNVLQKFYLENKEGMTRHNPFMTTCFVFGSLHTTTQWQTK